MSRKQFEKIDEQLTRSLRKSEALTWKSYQDKLKELRAYLADIYAKYGNGEKLPIGKLMVGNRLLAIQKEIDAKTKGLYSDIFSDIDKDLRTIYAGTYEATTGVLSMIAGKEIAGKLQLDILDKALKSPAGGVSMDLRMEALQKNATIKLTNAIASASARDLTLKETVDSLDKVFIGDSSHIKRIVNTEGHRLAEEAKHESAKQSGLKTTKTWVSMGDSNVRDEHRMLDGVTIGIDEEFEMGGAKAMFPGDFGVAELDINCRCWLEYGVEEG